MKVLLINPPMWNMIVGDSPLFLDEERGCNPPLGLLYIAALAKKQHDVEILDTQVDGLTYPQIEGIISKKKFDIVGIQTMTFTLIDALNIAKIVKKYHPDVPVVMGGPHVNIFPNETIKLPEIDFLILGEGEYIFTEFLNAYPDVKNLKKIKGLVFKDHKGTSFKIVHTGSVGLIENLDALPFPSRELLPYKKYSSLLAKREPVTTMMTSRGCPFRCSYCDRPHLGKRFRSCSAKYVVDEMESCVKLGIKEFLIYDDTFTIDRKRVVDICDEILKRKLDIGWDIRARVNTVDQELLFLLRKAGCERIHYGVEASDQRILDNLNKGITLKQVEDAFRWTKKAKIEILAYFMIGSPGEGEKEILHTMKYAKKLDPDFVSFSITTPFPATQLYLDALERGILKYDVWKEFAENPTKDFKAPMWTEKLSRKRIQELLTQAYKSFYIRPSFAIKKLVKIRSAGEFKRKAKAGLRLLRIK